MTCWRSILYWVACGTNLGRRAPHPPERNPSTSLSPVEGEKAKTVVESYKALGTLNRWKVLALFVIALW